MAGQDNIAKSVRLAWSESYFTPLMPTNHIYYDKAEQPAGKAGFPYASMKIEQVDFEVVTQLAPSYSLVTYQLIIDVWTCQDMTGGTSQSDQVVDQGNLMRAFQSVLNFITPNQAWNYVLGFLHCLPMSEATLKKDEELYLGKDVYKSTQNWSILCQE